jgi:hypothetical protein
MPAFEPLERRFFKYVLIDAPDKCWPWQGAYQEYGYGRIGVRTGFTDGAHRVSYQLHKGAIPEGLYVLHDCDNPACVNPKHLRLGTHQDNMDDMVARRRHLAGNRRSADARREARLSCKNGHPYADGDFRIVEGNGKKVRRCRVCERQWARDAVVRRRVEQSGWAS